jgi:hypothetical protein
MLYVVGYQIGFGPIVWLLISEIFPLRVRGPAMSIAVLMNFATNLVMTFTLESLLQVLTPPGVFFMYAGLTVFALIFVQLRCPETKGKTLEEIEAIMSNKRPPRLARQWSRKRRSWRAGSSSWIACSFLQFISIYDGCKACLKRREALSPANDLLLVVS